MEKGLTNNQLKLIALVSMTVDHVGMVLFPKLLWLRLIGRLAFPIFAYMIAEGCRHTKGMPRYLGTLAASAAVCQLVYFFVMGSLYQCIMVTFACAVGIIALIRRAQQTKKRYWWALAALGIAAAFFAAQLLPGLLPETDFGIDYGFEGIMLPVVVYLCPKRWRLAVMVPMLALVTLGGWEGQWMALAALPLLACYNGNRGALNLKWLFYIYYPAHLVALQALALLLGKA